MIFVILAQSVHTFLRILDFLILARVILSWVPSLRYHRWLHGVSGVVWQLTEPILAPIRNLLPMSQMGIDFSPIIAFFLLQIVGQLVTSVLYSLA